jgi:hypothetical protein
MTPRRISAAVFLIAGVAGLAGCTADGIPQADATPSTAPAPSASAGLGKPKASASPSRAATTSAKPTAKKTSSEGPRIVSFKVKQQPRCAEGTAVFRAKATPLIIEWTISGATGGALSVDDPTGTPGTYGSVDLHGTMEFPFGCGGAIGTTETHKYALYTVGGGPQRSKTITASAKVLDHGTATPAAG